MRYVWLVGCETLGRTACKFTPFCSVLYDCRSMRRSGIFSSAQVLFGCVRTSIRIVWVCAGEKHGSNAFATSAFSGSETHVCENAIMRLIEDALEAAVH